MITIPSILAALALVPPADAAGGDGLRQDAFDGSRPESFSLQGWRFTTDRPPTGWERDGFDDSRWKEGEVNGYLTYDRRPKVPPETISAIHAEGLRRRAEGAESPRPR